MSVGGWGKARTRAASIALSFLALASAGITLPGEIMAAVGPSFDCAKASKPVERLICDDPALATLDRELADVYRAAFNTLPIAGRDGLKKEQLDWMKMRDGCAKSRDVRRCVTLYYESRIGGLRQFASPAVPVDTAAQVRRPRELAAPSPLVAAKEVSGGITECDRLAAHPDDRQRAPGVAGIPDDGLNVQQALDACLAAVEAAPDEPRFNFQLGRLLRAADRDDDASGFLAQAAAVGHAGALAYLGDLSDDPEEKIAFYKAAAEAGFAPAAAVLANAEAESPGEATNAESEATCDRLAAHPADPSLPAGVTGVSEDDLNAEAAANACMEAVQRNPDPRYKFQLGRALIAAGLYGNAIEFLGQAAKAGHAGSMAYVADVYQEGLGVKADHEKAVGLYRHAAERGFTPAADALAALSAPVGEQPGGRQGINQPVKAPGSIKTQGFEDPDVVGGIYAGTFDAIPAERYTKIYLVNMVDAIRNVCPGTFTIREHESFKAHVIDRSDFTLQSGYSNLFSGLATWAGMLKNPQQAIEMQSQQSMAERIPEMANADAMLFIERHGCDSSITKKFNQNIRSYITDNSAPLNMTAEVYINACKSQVELPPRSLNQYCFCFLSQANLAGLSRGQKKKLINEFNAIAGDLVAKNPRHYAACQM